MKRKLLIFFLMLLSGEQKANLLKKLKYFGSIGDKCYLQPFNYGTEPNLIYMGDNVNIASGVKFVNHDVTYMMFNKMCGGGYKKREGKIVIGNNVFIGANAILLYDIEIGDNVIVGAGTLVNKDIPSGTVVAGVPAKIIGTFEHYQMKMIEYSRDFKEWSES